MIFLLFVSYNSFAQVSNQKTAQWKSMGGKLIISGDHKFTETWTRNSNQSELGFWKGVWSDRFETHQFSPWDPTVKNAVAPVKGQFTVRGPGHIGFSYQSPGSASIVLHDAKTKGAFHPFGLTANANPNGEFWGNIPADVEITLVVEAVMDHYDNTNNTGEFSYRAPQEITEFEIWFFPQEGGKLVDVKSAKAKFNKPKPGILYYIDNDCK